MALSGRIPLDSKSCELVYPRPIAGYADFALLGLGAGAVYAALGLGLVLIARSSGIVNFAHGAMAMVVTYLFVVLEARTGPGLALAVSLAAAAVLGLVVHHLVFRPLRHASALAGVAASVGVLTTLQALATLVFGSDSRAVPPVLPARPVDIAGLAVPGDRLALAAIVVAAGIGLWILYRFTRFGLASRAAAEDIGLLALLGWSPDHLAAANWALAGVLAGAAGILAGPITALNPVTSTLLVVPALAAAVVGRLSSFGLTVAVGLLLGMAEAETVLLQSRFSWIPRSGVREALPLLVIVVALALGAGRRLASAADADVVQRRPTSGPARRGRMPGAATTLAVVGAALVALIVLPGQARLAMVTSMIAMVLCMSIVVLTGYSGQISLAQMAFAGLSGFGLATLARASALPRPLAPLLAVALATVVGTVVGLPALRVRGVSLAVVTLAMAVAVEDLVFKNPLLTGGFTGSQVPTLGLGGPDSLAFGLFALTVTTITGLGVAKLRWTRWGRRFVSVSSNDRAAGAAGVDVVRTRLGAFAVSAFLAGVGGVVLAYSQNRLSFGSFGVFVSLSLLAVTFVGGISTVWGAVTGGLLVAGGVVFSLLDQAGGLGRYQLLVSGLALTAAAVLRPDGFFRRRSRS